MSTKVAFQETVMTDDVSINLTTSPHTVPDTPVSTSTRSNKHVKQPKPSYPLRRSSQLLGTKKNNIPRVMIN